MRVLHHQFHFLYIFEVRRPFAGSYAHNAAAYLCDALNEKQGARNGDDRFKLEYGHVGWTHDAHFASAAIVGPGFSSIVPSRNDERDDAGKEEQEIKHKFDDGLGFRLQSRYKTSPRTWPSRDKV